MKLTTFVFLGLLGTLALGLVSAQDEAKRWDERYDEGMHQVPAAATRLIVEKSAK